MKGGLTFYHKNLLPLEGMKAPRRQPAPVAAAAVHPHPRRRKAKSYIVLPHETERIKYRCWTQEESAMNINRKSKPKIVENTDSTCAASNCYSLSVQHMKSSPPVDQVDKPKSTSKCSSLRMFGCKVRESI